MAPPKLDIIGQQFTSLQGEIVTVVAYLKASAVTIQFEDGTQAVRSLQHLRTGSFDKRIVNQRTIKNGRLYKLFNGIYTRCHGMHRSTYIGCTIDDRWNSNSFVMWAINQPGSDKEDWQIDKDILIKGNKVYGPDTCCFVPAEINVAFTKSNAKRGKYPIGVRKASRGDKFTAQLGGTKGKKHLGTFATPEEAFLAYKAAKEDYIKSLALKYKDELDLRAFEALMSYEVEITD